MKSIFSQDPEICYLCGKRNASDVHHIFEGSNRSASDEYGLTIRICRECHMYIHHFPKSKTAVELKKYAQKKAMEHYGWSIEEWIEKFGKDYRERNLQ